MFKVNQDYLKLPGSYLFSTVARKQREYQAAHPEAEIIKLRTIIRQKDATSMQMRSSFPTEQKKIAVISRKSSQRTARSLYVIQYIRFM